MLINQKKNGKEKIYPALNQIRPKLSALALVQQPVLRTHRLVDVSPQFKIPLQIQTQRSSMLKSKKVIDMGYPQILNTIQQEQQSHSFGNTSTSICKNLSKMAYCLTERSNSKVSSKSRVSSQNIKNQTLNGV